MSDNNNTTLTLSAIQQALLRAGMLYVPDEVLDELAVAIGTIQQTQLATLDANTLTDSLTLCAQNWVQQNQAAPQQTGAYSLGCDPYVRNSTMLLHFVNFLHLSLANTVTVLRVTRNLKVRADCSPTQLNTAA